MNRVLTPIAIALFFIGYPLFHRLLRPKVVLVLKRLIYRLHRFRNVHFVKTLPNMESAIAHCTAGIGIWSWASNDQGTEPDVVMACAGDVPALETLAAVDLLRQHFPDLKIRVVNVVDLMTLQPQSEHPHGLSDREFDSIFTTDKPVIFAYHGYPWLIHRLCYRRHGHDNFTSVAIKKRARRPPPSI